MIVDLHAELEAVTRPGSTASLVGHALIALGLMTSVECAYEHCVLETRTFVKPQSRKNGRIYHQNAVPTVDHVVARRNGGTDQPQNMQLIHYLCNSTKGGCETIELRRSVVAEHSRRRWNNPEYRARMSGRVHTDNEKSKKRVSMTAHWNDPEKSAAHRTAIRRKQSPEERARRSESARAAWARRKKES